MPDYAGGIASWQEHPSPVIDLVIASEAKQPKLYCPQYEVQLHSFESVWRILLRGTKAGLLRFARNDGSQLLRSQ